MYLSWFWWEEEDPKAKRKYKGDPFSKISDYFEAKKEFRSMRKRFFEPTDQLAAHHEKAAPTNTKQRMIHLWLSTSSFLWLGQGSLLPGFPPFFRD